MKSKEPQIDFIDNGSKDCPLLRISGTNRHTACELVHAIRSMREGITRSFMIHEVPGYERCRQVSLTFELTNADIGVQQSIDGNRFRWLLSYDRWIRVEGQLAVFCNPESSHSGFQWLDESSNISLLFSPFGDW